MLTTLLTLAVLSALSLAFVSGTAYLVFRCLTAGSDE